MRRFSDSEGEDDSSDDKEDSSESDYEEESSDNNRELVAKMRRNGNYDIRGSVSIFFDNKNKDEDVALSYNLR